MAEGFLKSFNNKLEVFSAGTRAEQTVNPKAVAVMSELGIDISKGVPRQVDDYLSTDFDYVITVCDGAKEICPVFTGKVKNHLHIGFDDPADAKGTESEVMQVYRRVRDEIKHEFGDFYKNRLNG
jgi:arsenate reductase